MAERCAAPPRRRGSRVGSNANGGSYVVAAVEYAPAAAFVLFPDGRIGSMEAATWSAAGKLPQDSPELMAFERTQVEAGAAALRTALDELTRLDQKSPLSGRQMRGKAGLFFRPIGERDRERVERLFASYAPGTILVTPASPDFSHMSFSDLLLLRAVDAADKRDAALRNLVLVRTLTRTFFDHALKGATTPPAALPAQGYAELTVRTLEK